MADSFFSTFRLRRVWVAFSRSGKVENSRGGGGIKEIWIGGGEEVFIFECLMSDEKCLANLLFLYFVLIL